MRNILFLALLAFLLNGLGSNQAVAQDGWHWVLFTDKDSVEFNPYTYFDAKAIQRRLKQGYPLDDFTDLPVRQDYLNAVGAIADSTSWSTRWFNGGAFYLSGSQLAQIKQLSFVTEVIAMQQESVVCAQTVENKFDLGPRGGLRLAKAQTMRMGGDVFDSLGLKGKGVRVAILDAGFRGAYNAEAFEHIYKRNGVIATYDFVKKHTNVYGYHTHGSMVFSNIGGLIDTICLGLATEADFLLARTEKITSDGLRDERAWIAAMEWADKLGADIINSSLAYTTRRYFPQDMDGQKSLVSRSCTEARKKGILVVNAAGNEADNEWRTIGAPADHPDVLTVGGINPWTNLHTQFSSVGPAANHVRKPNVSAYGHVIAQGKKEIEETQGTSFASPLVAGFAACLLGADTLLKVSELFDLIEHAGDLHPYYDYAHGFGVPHASRALAFMNNETVDTDTTFDYTTENGVLNVIIRDHAFERNYLPMREYYARGAEEQDSMFYRNRKSVHVNDHGLSAAAASPQICLAPFFYMHVENDKGWLERYYVFSIENKNVISINLNDLKAGITDDRLQTNFNNVLDYEGFDLVKLRLFYRGYMVEIKVP